jgi:unsaturated chondroitin disaccharide hydrolase
MYQSVEANKQWISETWKKIDRKLQKTCIRSREKLPYTTVNGVHTNMHETNPCFWTNGFWGGMMWLMYLDTKNEEYKTTALRSEELLDKALEYYKVLHHDVGFLWLLTSVANYRITGNESACNKALFLASTLFSRFNIEAGFIRAWNGNNDSWSIIDTLMNLPLLYWASREIGDDRFTKVAMRHADTAIRDHLRPDGSVNHIVEHDVHTGEKIAVHAGGGLNENTSWSRGVAWTVYGAALSYIHTKEQRYLDAAIRAADHFIEQCKQTGYLAAADFYAPREPLYYDATSGVCAASGMIEIAKALSGERGEYYMGEAIKILKATDAHFCNYSDDEDALVLMGSERYPRDERFIEKTHMPIIYGDFFFVEALFKLKGNDFLIW